VKRPGVLTLARDTATYLGGWLLIFKQAGILFAPPVQPNEALIWAGLALITGTGVAQIIALRSGTGGPSSSSVAPVSPAPLPRSITSGGEREPMA
jgi:hypothetical protein